MTGPLLDFGSPFWNSENMVQELPVLASSGFESTGKYGIGFFSLFMWGSHVRVVSRRYKDAARDTRVLEFVKGLRARPTLRRAQDSEYLADGGTSVRIWVASPPESENGILFRPAHTRRTLEDTCAWLCPAIDANLVVQRANVRRTVVRASDWKTMNGEELLHRLADDTLRSAWMLQERERLIPLTARNLLLLTDKSGAVIGRAAIAPTNVYLEIGAITDGGLRACGLSRVAGLIKGSATKASRDVATPIVDAQTLAEWASSQQGLVVEAAVDKPALAYAADTVVHCGGIPGALPIALSSRGWASVEDIRAWKPVPDQVLIVELSDLQNVANDLGPVELLPNVLACGDENMYLITGAALLMWPDTGLFHERPFRNRSTESLVASLLAEKWSTTLDEVLAVSTIAGRLNVNWVEVGTVGGKPIRRSAHILRNPHAKPVPVVSHSPRKRRRRKT